MATEAQITANRNNSKKSTGPRTDDGKAIVSQNALKHGLFSSEMLIKGENREDFDIFCNEMLAELNPVGPVESMLAGRFVSLSWRLKRVERMQNQTIDVMLVPDMSEYARLARSMMTEEQRQLQDDPNLALGRAAIEDYSNSRVLDRLLMYERRMESSMFRTMAELQRLRLMRQMERAKAEEQEIESESLPPEDIQVDLKKQSQFAPPLIGAMSFTGGFYGNIPRPAPRENKPKQSQFPTPASRRPAVKAEKSLASAKTFTG